MKNALTIGNLFGIRIVIHWTFLILIAYIVIVSFKQGDTTLQILESIIFVLTIFGCVVLHEIGHALAARRYGINTRSITLLPIGGLASLDKIPEEPQRELFVAIAGPLVNIGIAGIIYAFLILTGSMPSDFLNGILSSTRFLPSLLAVNLLLAIFNLIPAFPMDGGRLLRAALSFRFDRIKATLIATRVGQLFAVLFAVYGFFNNPFLVIIAVFIFIAAQAEYADIHSKAMLAGKSVSDLMMTNFTPLHPDLQLSRVVEILLNGQEEEFIVTDNDQVVGVVTKNNIIKGLSEQGQDITTAMVMSHDFIAADPEDKINDVYEKMRHSGYKIIPVEHEGRLMGVIDIDNINKFMAVQETIRSRKWFGIFF